MGNGSPHTCALRHGYQLLVVGNLLENEKINELEQERGSREGKKAKWK